MKIVVYNTELEPVTVIDVPLDAYNSMNELGGLKVPVLDSKGVEHYYSDQAGCLANKMR